MNIPMDVPLAEQCIQFLCAVLLGFLLYVVYGITRFYGRQARPVLWDSVFTVLSLTAGTVFFLIECRGYPRIYHLLGIASGAALLRLLRRETGHWLGLRRRIHEKEKISSDTENVSASVCDLHHF